MAKKKKRTGYVAQDGSKAYFDRLAQQGVQQNNPAGTAYLMGSNELGYGVVAAYDGNNNFLGFVRGNLGNGVRVNYNPDGSASGITMPGDPPPSDPPPTTPKPPPPDLNAIPEDEQYRLDQAARQRALNTALANYGASEDALSSDYGISFGRYGADQFDAQGNKIASSGDVNFGSLALPDASRYDADRGFDTANPFSRASKLNQAFTSNRKISTGSYANRGLLTSGAYGRQQYRDADRYQGGIRALQGEFAQRLGEYRNQRIQARNDYETGNIDDRRQLIQRALQQYQLNNPSA